MQYSTLQEAYNVQNFKQPSAKKRNCSPASESSSQYLNNQQLYSIENSSLTANKESLENPQYNVQVPKNNTNKPEIKIKGNNSCTPLQAPTYTIPISGDCKKERDAAIKTYTDENFKTSEPDNNYESSVEFIANNDIDNIRPYYDEEMEQYFDINNLKDEVNYKSNSDIKINDYMPNYNKISYTNNNTNEYSNNNITSKNGINLLNNNEYILSDEEKRKAQEALNYLKSIEDKMYNSELSKLDPIKEPELTGPGGFIVKKTTDENILIPKIAEKVEITTPTTPTTPTTIHDAKLIESINENKKTQNIFNMLINIFIFVFIGILIILLCDYIAELAIQIGSSKTANKLDPFIKYHLLYMQNMANHNSSIMQNMQGGINSIPVMSNVEQANFSLHNIPFTQNLSYPIAKN